MIHSWGAKIQKQKKNKQSRTVFAKIHGKIGWKQHTKNLLTIETVSIYYYFLRLICVIFYISKPLSVDIFVAILTEKFQQI